MPFPPQRLSLTIALLISATIAHGKTVQIDTATTASQTLGGSDTLTISAPGSITNSGKAVSLKDSTSGVGVVIDNAGKIISTGGRAIDSSGDLTRARNYQIYNRSGGQILGANDALRVDSNFVSGSLLIDNSGIIRSTTGQGLDLDALRSEGVTTTIINRAGGLIRGDASDGMKTGAHATISNYGEISTGDSHNADEKFDGIDIDSATGVSITNYGGDFRWPSRHHHRPWRDADQLRADHRAQWLGLRLRRRWHGDQPRHHHRGLFRAASQW